MKTRLIKIGKSKGLRLSKFLIDRYAIKDDVKLILCEDGIMIKPVLNPREGWSVKFKEMHENGDDQLLISDVYNEEDPEQWT